MQKNKSVRSPYGILGWPALIMVIVLVSFSPIQQERKYKIEMTLQEIQTLVYCLNQSNAPSITTNGLIEVISKQVDPVLQAEKKIADSLAKKQEQKKN